MLELAAAAIAPGARSSTSSRRATQAATAITELELEALAPLLAADQASASSSPLRRPAAPPPRCVRARPRAVGALLAAELVLTRPPRIN